MSDAATTITREGNLLHVEPAHEDLLRDALIYQQRVHVRGRELAVHLSAQRSRGVANPRKFKFAPHSLYRIDARGRLVCMAGLLHRVWSVLDKAGLHLRFVDNNPPFTTPDLSQLGELRGNQDELLAAVLATDRCVADHVTGAGKTFMIGQIVRVLANEPAVVACPRKSIIDTNLKMLEEAGIHAGVCDGARFKPGRLMVCSAMSLHKLDDVADAVRLFIFDEVYAAAAPEISKGVGRFRYARMYGFADGALARGDGRQALIEAMFGPLVFRSNYRAAVALDMVQQIRVLVVPVYGDIPAYSNKPDDWNKRTQYWENDIRNRVIAESVQRAADFLALPLADTQILIFVDTLDHAVRLHALLPDFTVCHAGSISELRRHELASLGASDDVLDLTSARLLAHQKEFEAGTLKHVIATPIWNAGVNFLHLNVEIRADGRSSKLANAQLPGRLSRLGAPRVLVDFEDRFSEWAQGRSETRFRFYRQRGWEIYRDPKDPGS